MNDCKIKTSQNESFFVYTLYNSSFRKLFILAVDIRIPVLGQKTHTSRFVAKIGSCNFEIYSISFPMIYRFYNTSSSNILFMNQKYFSLLKYSFFNFIFFLFHLQTCLNIHVNLYRSPSSL